MKSFLRLNIYGYLVLIQSEVFDCNNLKAAVDFEHFKTNDETLTYNLNVTLNRLYSTHTQGLLIGKTKMCRVRQKGIAHRELEYIHNDKTLAIASDDTSKKTRLFCVDAINLEVIDDILYFFLNSSAGEYLEYCGKSRVHALSYTHFEDCILVHGDPGYGKSTLALELLKNPDVKIFSDEITVIDLNTKLILPYPMRIASVESLANQEGSENLKFTYFFKKKSLVRFEKDKISPPGRLKKIFYLNRSSSTMSANPLNFFGKVKLSIKILLGSGLIQMWEYLLRFNNLHVLLIIFYNRLRLIGFIWKLNISMLNKNSELHKKINCLLQI